VHQTSSKHAFTSRHGRISNRCPNQKDITGKNRAHSNRDRAGTSAQEAERIARKKKLFKSSRMQSLQKPEVATAAEAIKIE
jgi:hypothetical protein